MLSRIALKLVLAASIVAGSCSSHAGKPTVGLSVSVEGEGFFLNPVVTRVLVAKVQSDSLAERAGIVAGDEITHVGDQAIKGRRANDLQPLMKFNAGETRVLRLKRINGEHYSATLTKPKE
jgi:C-terminal processing protease CtpA/Prc